METQEIRKGQPQLKSASELKKIFVNDTRPGPNADICGLLRFSGSNGDTYSYAVVGNGCVTIYLTDCQGNVEAATQYTCIAGNTLNVEGCHAFGCSC
jgi:hypothetical protein